MPVELTIRQKIIDKIFEKLDAMRDFDDDTLRIWQKVYKGDLTDFSNARVPCIGIDEGTEDLLERYGGCSHYQLPVILHFRFEYKQGVDNLDRYKYYLGILQREVLSDHQLNDNADNTMPLSTDIVEEGNAPAVLGQEDQSPAGTLNILIKYRTMTHNPYKRPGEPE